MTDEEYVRARWENVKCVDFYAGKNCAVQAWYVSLNARWSGRVGGTADDPEMWKEARAFTEQREREIAEVREEISEIEDDVLSYSAHDNADSFAVIYRRILARLQTVLAELRRGMKEGSE